MEMSGETPVWWAEAFAHPPALPDNTTVTVWCDDAAHPAERGRYVPETGRWWLFVAEFRRPNILWEPMPQRRAHPGVKWWVDEDGNRHTEPDAGKYATLRHQLACRYCKRPLTVRAGKFDAVLGMIADTGRKDVTLAELSVILQTSRGM
jgi:hypothetical protein